MILSSGVWREKFETDFQAFDTQFVAGVHTDTDPAHVTALFRHVTGTDSPLTPAHGRFDVMDGRLVHADVTVLHNRSVAEDVHFHVGGAPYTGTVTIENGALTDAVSLRGKSLLHSVPLTAEAFKRSAFGEYGQYAVTVGLVLFAFSTALAWSYYGDRAVTYLFGTRVVTPYRVVYVLAFFLAAVMDTSLVWLVSAITLALMALPNLLGCMLLRREMKAAVREYWSGATRR